ncbi:DUF4267 domain-containing protein [Aspergillus lucknowensis]|uniref:DUF4267 domain-containing protein n=1 Tax=Aspergillus lucknowensis TaxID=176173 RepID=A0ABR4M3K0_9EURO
MALGTVADALARTLAVILSASGPLWFRRPVEGVLDFGLPRTSPDIATFTPAVGGRNTAAGVMVLVTSLYASRRLTAVFLATWATGAGLSDTAVCLPGGVGTKRHLVNVAICYAVSILLWVAS